MPPLTVQVDEYSLYVSTRTPKGQPPTYAPLAPPSRAGVAVTSRPNYDEYTRLVAAHPALPAIVGQAVPVQPALIEAPNGEEVALLLGVNNKNLDHTTFQATLQNGTILSAQGGALFRARPDPAFRQVVQAGTPFTVTAQAQAMDLFGNPLTWTVSMRTTGSLNAMPPPVGVAGSNTASEDLLAGQAFQLTAIDQGGGVGGYELVRAPTDVSFSFDTVTGVVTWHPNGKFETLKFGQSASRTFEWRPLSSALVPGLTVTGTLIVSGVNDAPVAVADTVSVLGSATDIVGTFNWFDPEGDALWQGAGPAFEITAALAAPAGVADFGTFTLINDRTGQWRYTLDGDFALLPEDQTVPVTVGFRVRDVDGLWSNPMTLTIAVIGHVGNAVPVFQGGIYNLTAGEQIDVNLEALAADADNDIQGFTLAGAPLKGTAQLRPGATKSTGSLRFNSGNAFSTLQPGSSETVFAVVECFDSRSNAALATFEFVVSRAAAPPQPPSVNGATFQTPFDAALAGQLTATDPDGDLAPNGWALAAPPAQGVFVLNANGSFTFNPNGQFNDLLFGQSRTVTALVTASDAGGRVSTVQGIQIVVTRNVAFGAPPVVLSRTTFSDYLDATAQADVSAQTTDPDGDINENGFELVGAPVVPPGAAFVFNPNGFWVLTFNNAFAGFAPGQSTTFSFNWRARDLGGNIASPSATRTVVISRQAAAPQNPPVAADHGVSVNKNATIVNASLPAATDADGNLNANGYALFGPSLNPDTDGILTFRADGTFDYDPAGLFNDLYATPTLQTATRTVQYTASDATGLVSTPKTLTITINGVGAMPSMAMYPMAATAAIEARWPWENVAMGRFMALEAAYPPDRTTVASGVFSNPAIWSGGVVPSAGQTWKVAEGHTVTFDQTLEAVETDNVLYNFVHVEGTLIFDPSKSVRLRCDTLITQYGGHFERKPAGNFVHDLLYECETDIDVVKDPALLTRGRIMHGTIDEAGKAKQPYAEADLNNLPALGATTILLAAAVPANWEVGDRLVIPGADQRRTDFTQWGATDAGFETDVVTITGIAGSTVTFTPALGTAKTGFSTIETDIVDYCDETPTLGGDRPQFVVMNLTRSVRQRSRGGAAIAIHRRAHSMIMHRVDGANIAIRRASYDWMGRTNKRLTAGTSQQWVLDNGAIAANANLKGRYAEHFHWVSYNPETHRVGATAAIMEGCSFANSPGWHLAVHRGKADVVDNVGFDAFGHFVWETGDEQGLCAGNVAMQCRARRADAGGASGVPLPPKDGAFANRHDHGADGNGFSFFGRSVKMEPSALGWNRVYNSEGWGLVWIHRTGGGSLPGAQQGGYASFTKSWGPHEFNALDAPFPAALHYFTDASIDHGRLDIRGLQVSGARVGVYIAKSAPPQENDLRNFFTDIICTGVENGFQGQYSAHYSIRRFALEASRRYAGRGYGISVVQNTFDWLWADGKITGFLTGADIAKISTNAPPEPIGGFWQFVLENVKWGAGGGVGLLPNTADYPGLALFRTGQDGVSRAEDQLFGMTLAGVTYAAAPNPKETFAFALDFYQAGAPAAEATPTWSFTPGNYEWRGTVTDKYGARPVPNLHGPNGPLASRGSLHGEILWRDRTRVAAFLKAKGYWRTSANGPAYLEDEIILTPRPENFPRNIPLRLFLGADVPGVNAAPSAFSDNVNFTFNGVKP